MRRSRISSEKKRKRRSKVSRRNSRKTNYSRRNYRRKTRKTRKRQMTRKKLRGGMKWLGPAQPEPEPQPEPEQDGPIIFAVFALGSDPPKFKEYSPADNAIIYDVVVKHHYNDQTPCRVEIDQRPVHTEAAGHAEAGAQGPCNVLLGKDVIQYAERMLSMGGAEDKQAMAWIKDAGAIPMFQYDDMAGNRYINIRQIRIAKNRKEIWTPDTKKLVREAGGSLGNIWLNHDHRLISCFKARPTAGNWPERIMQIKNQSLLFYESYEPDDPKPRGSSVIDITGSSIEVGTEWFISGLRPKLTITPNPILNPPTKYGNLFQTLHPKKFEVEEYDSPEKYNGQTKTVALDSEGKMRIAFHDPDTAAVKDILYIISNYEEPPPGGGAMLPAVQLRTEEPAATAAPAALAGLSGEWKAIPESEGRGALLAVREGGIGDALDAAPEATISSSGKLWL
jgi:hypothetical protein